MIERNIFGCSFVVLDIYGFKWFVYKEIKATFSFSPEEEKMPCIVIFNRLIDLKYFFFLQKLHYELPFFSMYVALSVKWIFKAHIIQMSGLWYIHCLQPIRLHHMFWLPTICYSRGTHEYYSRIWYSRVIHKYYPNQRVFYILWQPSMSLVVYVYFYFFSWIGP